MFGSHFKSKMKYITAIEICNTAIEISKTTKNSLHYTKPCISTNTHKNMSPDDGTVATPPREATPFERPLSHNI